MKRYVDVYFIGDSTTKYQAQRTESWHPMDKSNFRFNIPFAKFLPDEFHLQRLMNLTIHRDFYRDRAGDGIDQGDLPSNFFNTSDHRHRSNIVYLNFGWLHCMQLHPHARRWVSSPHEFNYHDVGSFACFNNAEKWIRRDLSYLLERSYIDLIVIMTNHMVCESKFKYATYHHWYANVSHHLKLCSEWVIDKGTTNNEYLKNQSFFNLPGKDSVITENQALMMCENSSIGRNGSVYFYTLMMNVLESFLPHKKLRIVDAYNITKRAGCDHTADGVHYDDTIVDIELDALMRVTTQFLVSDWSNRNIR